MADSREKAINTVQQPRKPGEGTPQNPQPPKDAKKEGQNK